MKNIIIKCPKCGEHTATYHTGSGESGTLSPFKNSSIKRVKFYKEMKTVIFESEYNVVINARIECSKCKTNYNHKIVVVAYSNDYSY